MTDLFWAQAGAVALVLFGGMQVYQLSTSHADMQSKADRFLESANETYRAALPRIRLFLYGGMPLAFLGLLYRAGIPVLALIACAFKIGASITLSLWLENGLLASKAYTPGRHRLARLDGALNLALTLGLIYVLLYLRRGR